MKDESMSYLDALKEIKRLKEAVGKIKAEIGNKTHPNYTGHNEYEMAVSDGYSNALLIIDKHTEGLI